MRLKKMKQLLITNKAVVSFISVATCVILVTNCNISDVLRYLELKFTLHYINLHAYIIMINIIVFSYHFLISYLQYIIFFLCQKGF